MNAIYLKGHSGCSLELNDNRSQTLTVRKVSKSISYNDRLKMQMKKQENFLHKELKAPKIFNSGITLEKLFFFEMEYINGRTLAHSIETLSPSEIAVITNQILAMHEHGVHQDSSAVITKCNELKSATSIEFGLDSIFTQIYKNIPTSIEKTRCHGDLTFENIILSNNNVYLIDFLDSYANSWVIDFSKILQDSIGCWSFRDQYPPSIVLASKLELITNLVFAKAEAKGIKQKELLCFVLINFIRILPYTTDEKTKIFILKQINKISQMIG